MSYNDDSDGRVPRTTGSVFVFRASEDAME